MAPRAHQSHFDMQAHIGVYMSGLVQAAPTTAHVPDVG